MLGIAEIDIAEYHNMFAKFKTLCEAKQCEPDRQPAYAPYQNGVVFIFLCKTHWDYAHTVRGYEKSKWDASVMARMREFMDRHSYVKTNMNSDFKLENMLAARNEVLSEMARLESKEEGATRRDLRKQIREAPEKIGAADQTLLDARQRQAGRVAAGGKPVGPAPKNRAASLIPRLVIRDTNTKEEDK